MGFVTTAAEILAFLRSKGFTIETGHGRHGTKAVRGKQKISIPMHSRDLATGTANGILAQAGYTINDLMEWRRG
jgi:predicted RNA binding protein YcfA (HicA-like mRNA interferase family)